MLALDRVTKAAVQDALRPLTRPPGKASQRLFFKRDAHGARNAQYQNMKHHVAPLAPRPPNQRITSASGPRAVTPVRKNDQSRVLGTAKKKRPLGTPLPAHLTPFGNLLRGTGNSVPDSLLLSYRAIGLVSRADGRGCFRWWCGLGSGSGLGGYCLGSATAVGRREGCEVFERV